MKTGVAAILLALASVARATDFSCMEVKAHAEVRRTVADARGHPVVRLVPADTIAAGEELFYTVSAANLCHATEENVVIDFPLPPHMTLVAGSAIAPAAQVLFSVDGGFHYYKAEELKVTAPGAEPRPAKPEDYTHIRWVLSKPLAPEAVVLARFRAVVK